MSNNKYSLVSFSVFNSKFAISEDEPERKILYYYPAKDALDSQVIHVGFCEAACNFATTFTHEIIHSVHNERSCSFFLNPEEDYWMILKILKPKDSKRTVHILDKIYKSLLLQAYDMFKLFNGSFSMIMDGQDNPKRLKVIMNHFFSEYIVNLDTSKASLLNTMNGVEFYALDRGTYLRIQSFINRTRFTFTPIQRCIFMYNNALVWNGIEDNIGTMYRYIVGSLFPEHLKSEIANVSRKNFSANKSHDSRYLDGDSSHYGSFIIGPKNLKKVYIDGKMMNLVLFRALGASLIMFIEEEFKLTDHFWVSISEILGPQLAALASDINEHVNNKNNHTENDCSYVYFNNQNLALKTNYFHNQQNFNDLFEQLLSEDMKIDSEIVIKNNAWMTAIQAYDRQLYILLNNTKMTGLIEANDEVQKICNKEFNRIFTF